MNLIKLMKSFINEAESYLIKAKGTLGYEDVLEFYGQDYIIGHYRISQKERNL